VPTDPGTRSPSTVFGLAAYNGEAHLAQALESLLTQTRGDLAVVVVDDCSTDGTRALCLRYVELDPRVVYERNDRQLGLVRNWRRAFDLAGERFPAASYFAWASDHDVWHPEWLEAVGAELDAHPEAVLAYPFAVRIDDFGSEYPTRERPFETAGLAREERLRRVARDLTGAGELVYGLGRRAALERAGPYPLVVLADRLHLVRLALEGEFRQVRRRLWYRRFRTGVVMTNSRQRRTSFPDGAPLSAYVPWWLTHTLNFLRSLAGQPGRARLGTAVLLESVRHAYERSRARGQRRRRWRRRERSRRFRGALRGFLQRLGLYEARTQAAEASVTTQPETGISEALEGLERAELLGGLAAPGAVLLELGGGRGGIFEQLGGRFPGLTHAVVDEPGRLASAALAVSVGALERLPEVEVERWARRLHEAGVPALYSLDRESPGLRAALGRWYWLRDVWVPPRASDGATGRKPDPTTGPVPREPGRYRHLAGRRRLLPEHGSTAG
jgi:hypothetical protein